MNNKITLLIPEKIDPESEQVAIVWTNHGGQVKRLGKYWIKDEALQGQPIAIYGNQTFALVLAQIYNVELLSPNDALIAKFDRQWTKRTITLKEIGQVQIEDFPSFIKPVIPKLFLAGIFQTLSAFKNATNGLQDNEQVLLSNIITPIQAEARSYISKGIIKDIALYEGTADLTTAKEFLTAFLESSSHQLPEAVVIDLAYNEQAGWFLLELNACWGAGLNNCRAENVIECIINATVN